MTAEAVLDPGADVESLARSSSAASFHHSTGFERCSTRAASPDFQGFVREHKRDV